MCVCFFCSRYVSIKPDSRKLANGTNVLGLLIDTLLMEGFHLVGNRTVSSEDKTECYSFERIKRPEALAMNKTVKPEAAIMPGQSQKKKWVFLFSFKGKLPFSCLLPCHLWATTPQQCLSHSNCLLLSEQHCALGALPHIPSTFNASFHFSFSWTFI